MIIISTGRRLSSFVLHEAKDQLCTGDGLIILEPCGKKEDVEQLVKDLNDLDGVTAKLIDLN